ncbi:MAG: peptide chain release factor N(5)-glutamine methyltransferase [Candidatus Gracilibacteria bacterium]
MLIGEVLRLAQKAHLRIEMEVFLCDLLGLNRLDLVANSKDEIPVEKLALLQKAWVKIMNGVPVAYLTHKKEFFGIELYVDENVLIPRPCTEQLVTWALSKAQDSVLEIGTGSGAIAIAIKKTRPELKVVATDVSSSALVVANKNCVQCGVDIGLIQSDLLDEVPQENFDTLVCNLPYIGLVEHASIAENVEKYEPHLALFGGEDGLELYRRLFEQIRMQGRGFKYVFGELGFSQGEAIRSLACELLPEMEFTLRQDYEGLDRHFLLERKPFSC